MSEAFEIKETGRIEAFSDGVFAIAITLLVLTIKAPVASELGSRGLGRALLALWPHYLAFVTSFAIILHPQTRVAGGLFTGTVLAIALMFKGLWRYAARGGRLLARGADAEDVRQVADQHRYQPLMYLGAFGLSFASTSASVVVCLALAVFFGFKGWPSRGE